MKKHLIRLLAAATSLMLAACFQQETTITLEKDGSGTLVEETRIGAQMLGMVNQFGGGLGDEDQAAQDPLKDLMSEEKAKDRAKRLGEGVEFVKIEPVSVGAFKGARATYRFQNINDLRISTEDAMNQIGSAAPSVIDDIDADADDAVTFNFKDGVLKIQMGQPEEEEAATETRVPEVPQGIDQSAMMEMMKPMMADMKVSIRLVAAPGIAETDATYHDGDSITLMELDMNQLMKDPANFKKFSSIDQNKPNAGIDALKGIDGVKAESQPEVSVKLR
ncbi:MAG: hypothetical protein ACO3RV_02385 [Luteolibacter sp.]